MSFRKEYPAIYVGNVNRSLTEEQLEHVFEPLGYFQLQSHKKGDCKGWGFLCFANTPNANRARIDLRNARLVIRGLTLDIGKMRSWATTDKSLARVMDRKLAATNLSTALADVTVRIAKLSHSVFVGNLPNPTTKADIYNLFSQCGDIITHFVAVNSERDGLGYGFIDFRTEGGAMAAIEKFNGYRWRNCKLHVDPAKDVNRKVHLPLAKLRTVGDSPTAITNLAPWATVVAQRQQPSPAPTSALAGQPSATIVPVVAPVVRPAAAAAPPPATASASGPAPAPYDLDATIRSIAPNLLQIALAVNAVEGLEYGLGLEDAGERLVKSSLLRTAVKSLVEKLEDEKKN